MYACMNTRIYTHVGADSRLDHCFSVPSVIDSAIWGTLMIVSAVWGVSRALQGRAGRIHTIAACLLKAPQALRRELCRASVQSSAKRITDTRPRRRCLTSTPGPADQKPTPSRRQSSYVGRELSCSQPARRRAWPGRSAWQRAGGGDTAGQT